MSDKQILFLAPAQAVTRIFSVLKDAGVEVGIAENMRGASAFIRQSLPLLIISRPTLPGYKVEDLLAVALDDSDFPPIIVTAEKGSVKDAEHYLEAGAKDYWLEPLDPQKILACLPSKKDKAIIPPFTSLGGHKPEPKNFGPVIVGQDPSIHKVLALARQVAPSKATVLISGESGTGKEMFARYVHILSGRQDKSFVAVNCAALPEHLLESELFGHEKGSFTGAIAKKLGKFELAHGGTLLLDEISEMDLALQAKLLRVLQEGEVDRVGGAEPIKVDVRVIATTNRDLLAWVKEGKFRQDLYFRLNVIPLRLPALAERGQDIERLAEFFIKLYVKEYNLPDLKLSEEVRLWLLSYDWPGNVRELQNLMERAVLLAGLGPITTQHFLLDPDAWPLFKDSESTAANRSAQMNYGVGFNESEEDILSDNNTYAHNSHIIKDSKESAVELFKEQSEQADSSENSEQDEYLEAVPQSSNFDSQEAKKNESSKTQNSSEQALFSGAVMPLHEVERIMIIRGLEQTSGNRTHAAELLGISVRTLRNKLNDYRELGLETL